MRNVNVISVPGEASVLFATSKISAPAYSGTMTTSSAGSDTVTLSTLPESGQAIYFTVLSDATKGIALNTFYRIVSVSTGVYNLYSGYNSTSLVNITADSLTGTWATYNMGQPKYFAYANDSIPSYWMVDANGLVWSNKRPTNNNQYWTYTGNQPNNQSTGNGLVYYQASDGTGYIFVFSQQSIDYSLTYSGIAWNYGWNYLNGSLDNAGAWKANPTPRLNFSYIHEAFVAPNGRVYFCNGTSISGWYQTLIGTPFVPTTLGTYTPETFSLLPFTDLTTCLAPLGNIILIGGQNNLIYCWDTASQYSTQYIYLAEFNIHRMITVNTNTFIFVGNRGRIYVTNGTNAQLYKKVPDHISGTVEPYFQWGGACSVKNQLYFSCIATTNAGGVNSEYGGVWAIDMDTQAIRLTNQLSYGIYAGYAGYAPTMIPNFASNAAGTGLYIGWDDGTSHYGIDTSSFSPYTGSQATIDSDLIPIGTFNKPKDMTQVEYRLTKALVSGESIVVQVRLLFDKTDQTTPVINTYQTILTDSTVGYYSNTAPVNFQQAQWVQFRIILNSTVLSPSYVRLKNIRILGLTGQSAAQAPLLTV
jgi:hypothetical protein